MDIQEFKKQMGLDIATARSLEEEINRSHEDGWLISVSKDTLIDISQQAVDIKGVCKKLRRGESNISMHNKFKEYNKVICMEELAELIDAISTMESCEEESTSEDNKLHILEEMADVTICIQLLMNMYNFSNEELDKAIRVKCENYRRKLKQEQG